MEKRQLEEHHSWESEAAPDGRRQQNRSVGWHSSAEEAKSTGVTKQNPPATEVEIQTGPAIRSDISEKKIRCKETAYKGWGELFYNKIRNLGELDWPNGSRLSS
jgi:hypothetical protein